MPKARGHQRSRIPIVVASNHLDLDNPVPGKSGEFPCDSDNSSTESGTIQPLKNVSGQMKTSTPINFEHCSKAGQLRQKGRNHGCSREHSCSKGVESQKKRLHEIHSLGVNHSNRNNSNSMNRSQASKRQVAERLCARNRSKNSGRASNSTVGTKNTAISSSSGTGTLEEIEVEVENNSKSRRIPRKRRYRPGELALKEIRRYQKTTHLLLPRLSFQRVVREVCQSLGAHTPMRWTATALECLQEASEAFLINLLQDSYYVTMHCKRITLAKRDMELARRIRGHQ